MFKKRLITTLFLLGSAVFVVAQNAATPYSIFGIGIVSDYGLAYHDNMGGLGISNGKPWILNNVNPALLPMNNFSTFDAGLYTEKRNLTTSELSQSNTNGGLSYLTFGFPIKNEKWTMAFGLMPYSNVSYNIITTGSVVDRDQATAAYQYEGDGGINQVYMSNGWQLIPDVLSVGARIGYIFGTVTDQTTINLSEFIYVDEEDTVGIPKDFRTSRYYRSSRYSDILLEGGLNFSKKFGKQMLVSFGLVYELGANVNTSRNERLETIDAKNTVLASDGIVEDAKASTYFPQKYGVGLSLSKGVKWTFGVDYYSRDWTKFENEFETNQELTKSTRLIIGGEYTPDFFSVTSYAKRLTYQFGFNYEETPVKINNVHIDDFGINFGVSLPVGNASILNVGFKYGQLGTTTDGLIKEDYFKLNIGMTFNDRSYGWHRNQRKFN